MVAREHHIDPVELTEKLIACPSVTPAEGGALDVLEAVLVPLGFECHRLAFQADGTERVENLFAKLGDGSPHLMFAGHSDVVPPGPAEAWTSDPFTPVRDGEYLRGRGAADMKSAIASFIAAVATHLGEYGPPETGSISLLITGDEEGPAVNGTAPVLDWMEARGLRADGCIVGEPTNPFELGEMMKIGRRGSLNGVITVRGRQGHVAYPYRADNPLPKLALIAMALDGLVLDVGSPHFQASNLEITSIDTGNEATNVIPGEARLRFNVRFNDLHTSADVEARIRERLDLTEQPYDLEIRVSGESFLTEPGKLSELVADAAAQVTGQRPEPSTSGGTSDARFIARHCPVVEFGIVGETMHRADEQVRIADIEALAKIYGLVLEGWFAAN